MIASIFSKEVRLEGSMLEFSVDHSNFSKTSPRIVNKDTYLNGDVVTTDWGFSEGNRRIAMSNIIMSESDFDILKGMEEDNVHTFYFAYENDLWNVIIQNLISDYLGGKYKVNFSLSVISKLE